MFQAGEQLGPKHQGPERLSNSEATWRLPGLETGEANEPRRCWPWEPWFGKASGLNPGFMEPLNAFKHTQEEV